jgi:phosphate transport system protein
MSKHLQVELEKLKKKIFELCTMVEESVTGAIRSVLRLDIELAKKLIENDTAIDMMEIYVEEECLKILALHQPVAIDLRFIISALKINNDLERIGDLAVNIAQRTQTLAELADSNSVVCDFAVMSEKAVAMVKKSLDAFMNYDPKLSREVCDADDEVDDLHKEMYSVFKREVDRNSKNIEVMLQYLSISRNLERIADHATNIAEDVIYMTQGDIVRHRIKN